MDKFYGAVVNGKLILDARNAFAERVREMDNQNVVLILLQHRRRSNNQNRYYWGAIIPIVRDAMKKLGVEFSETGTHELLKYKFLKCEHVTTDGEVIETIKSTTELTPTEFNEYIEAIQQWSAEYLNIVIPDPNTQTDLFKTTPSREDVDGIAKI